MAYLIELACWESFVRAAEYQVSQRVASRVRAVAVRMALLAALQPAGNAAYALSAMRKR